MDSVSTYSLTTWIEDLLPLPATQEKSNTTLYTYANWSFAAVSISLTIVSLWTSIFSPPALLFFLPLTALSLLGTLATKKLVLLSSSLGTLHQEQKKLHELLTINTPKTLDVKLEKAAHLLQKETSANLSLQELLASFKEQQSKTKQAILLFQTNRGALVQLFQEKLPSLVELTQHVPRAPNRVTEEMKEAEAATKELEVHVKQLDTSFTSSSISLQEPLEQEANALSSHLASFNKENKQLFWQTKALKCLKAGLQKEREELERTECRLYTLIKELNVLSNACKGKILPEGER